MAASIQSETDSACSDTESTIDLDDRSQVEEFLRAPKGLLEKDWHEIFFMLANLEQQISMLQRNADDIGWLSEIIMSLGPAVENISARHKSTLKYNTWGEFSCEICSRLIRGEAPSAECARGRLKELLERFPVILKRFNAPAGFRALFQYECERSAYTCCLLLVAREGKDDSVTVTYGLCGTKWKLDDDSMVEHTVLHTRKKSDARVGKASVRVSESSEMSQVQMTTVGGESFTVSVHSVAAIASLKLALAKDIGVPVSQQRLFLGEEELLDNAPVSGLDGVVTVVHETPRCTECGGEGVCRACGGHKLWQWKDRYQRTKAKKAYEFTTRERLEDFSREGYVYGCGNCGGSGSNNNDSGECDIVFGSGKCCKCSGTGYLSMEFCYEEQRKHDHRQKKLKCQKRKLAFQSMLINGAFNIVEAIVSQKHQFAAEALEDGFSI